MTPTRTLAHHLLAAAIAVLGILGAVVYVALLLFGVSPQDAYAAAALAGLVACVMVMVGGFSRGVGS